MTCIYSVKIFSMMSVPISCFPDLYKTNVKFWKVKSEKKINHYDKTVNFALR